MYKLCAFLLFSTLITSTNLLKAQKIKLLQEGKPTSIRGLSVVNNKTAWISGSKGYVATTNNGGKTWNWQQVKGYEQADFRDIEAFSNKEAIIMSSGTPAYILKTIDGGTTWDLKYSNTDKAYFLDAMDFADKKHGYTLGDPINNKFLLLETIDSGNSWHPFNSQPEAMPGQAAFAASGTCLRVDHKGNITFVTGGKVANCIDYSTTGNKWFYTYLPIKQGKESQGAFSTDQEGSVYVGGDYTENKISDSTACLFDPTIAGAKNGLRASAKFPAGYQSCVEYLFGKKSKLPKSGSLLSGFYISTGTSGTNISKDGALTWQQIDNTSYNVCRKAKRGSLVLLAGDKGKIAIFEL